MGYQLKTENGYDLMECASALQKTIRRGLEEEAMFWATELETKFPDYLWLRLTVIANEDIGLASPETLTLLEALRTQAAFLRAKSKSPSERLPLANAILALCRASKTRLADDFQAVIYKRRDHEQWRLEVPDYALDKHTRRGKALGRGWTHWRTEGCRLHPEFSQNPYETEAHKLREAHGKAIKPTRGKQEAIPDGDEGEGETEA